MPLAAYFRNAGAVLLALLWLADYYLATPPVAAAPPAGVKAEVHSPAIRIHAQPKEASPIIYDTTQVTFAAVAPASWDMNPPAPPVHKISIDEADVASAR